MLLADGWGFRDGCKGGVKVCRVFDSIEPEAQRARRWGYRFSSLLKQNKKAKICFVIHIAGKNKLLFHIYAVIVKQKIYERSSNHYCGMQWQCWGSLYLWQQHFSFSFGRLGNCYLLVPEEQEARYLKILAGTWQEIYNGKAPDMRVGILGRLGRESTLHYRVVSDGASGQATTE